MRHSAALVKVRALASQLTTSIIALGVLANAAAAQTLLYDHATFLNGFASSPVIWRAHFSALNGDSVPQYINRSIVLKTIDLFNVDTAKRYDDHVIDLYNYLNSAAEHHVLIGHSLGALVSRGVYNDDTDRRANISAIVGLAAPHQGTLLANNATTAKAFVNDVQRRVNDAKPYARIVLAVASVLFGVAENAQGLFNGIAVAILVWPLPNLDVSAFNSLAAMKALPDLRVDSPAITHLNAVSADDAIQRVNITGNIPARDAAIRLEYSAKNDDAHFGDGVHTKRLGLVAFKACKYVGYATIVLSPAARKCAYAVKMLERLDDQWAGFVNGRENRCFLFTCAINVGRTVPFDGAVSNERQRWPGAAPTYEAGVAGADHLNIYAIQDGLRQVIEGMKRIHMVQQPPPLAASISGPSTLSGMTPGTWTAGLFGGVGQYRYQWSGILSGTGASVTGTGNGTLYLDVWDSNGGHAATSKLVTRTASTCGFKIFC